MWLLAPAIGLALELRPSEIGLLLTIHSIGASLAYFPAGILADRVRSQGVLLLGTFWWVTLGYLLASGAPGFWSLAILIAIGGMGDAAWHPIATGMLVRQMPDKRGQALGIHAIGGTLAEVFSPLMVGFLLAVLDWQQVLQLSVLPAALMGTAFFFLFRRIPSRHVSTALTKGDLVAFLHQWRSRTGLLLVGGIATYNMALVALMTMMPFYSQRAFGLSPAETVLRLPWPCWWGRLASPWWAGYPIGVVDSGFSRFRQCWLQRFLLLSFFLRHHSVRSACSQALWQYSLPSARAYLRWPWIIQASMKPLQWALFLSSWTGWALWAQSLQASSETSAWWPALDSPRCSRSWRWVLSR